MGTIAALIVALAMAEPSAGYTPPPIDTSVVKDSRPRDVAKRALGPAAASYANSVLVEFPPSGDLPPPGAVPSFWSVQFFETPKLLAPGLCMTRELGVSVEMEPAYATPGPKLLRALKAYPAYAFRVVGALPRPDQLRGALRAQAAEVCDRLRPVGRYMLNRDAEFPGATGAFAADSPEVGLRGAVYFDRIAGARRSRAKKARCSGEEGDLCRDAGKILSEVSFDTVVYIAARPCPAGVAGRACVQVETLHGKGKCWLMIVPGPGLRAGPDEVVVTCRVPPQKPPGFWPAPVIVSESEAPIS